MEAKPKPKRDWRLPNGGRGVAGPGRPRGPGKPKPRALHVLEDEEKLENDGRDWAAYIARAIFRENAPEIYRAFAKKITKGDSRVFQALANRAYRLPQQEIAFAHEKPFKLIIEYIGENRQEEIGPTIEGEELPQKNDQERPERLLHSKSASTPEDCDESS